MEEETAEELLRCERAEKAYCEQLPDKIDTEIFMELLSGLAITAHGRSFFLKRLFRRLTEGLESVSMNGWISLVR